MPKFSIIIPVCGQLEMTSSCLDSIQENSSDYEIILVDNGSQPKIQSQYKCIRNEENLGFPIAVNQGIKEATGEIIVILNNDVIVTPSWLDRLAHHLKYADMVGPISNNVSGPQRTHIGACTSALSLEKQSEKLYKEKCLQSTPWHRLVFFCVAIKREVIDKIGLLDEQFSPGNFEDDDFCLRAIEAGFHLVIADDVFIYHHGSQTHKSLKIDYANLLKTNQAKFEAKWSPKKQFELREKAQLSVVSRKNLSKKSLALVMIIKNEAKGLEKAVESARSICDEIVIAVDESSTDGSLEIARRLATEVKRFKWLDDFSAVRNFAAMGVKSDWILFLDGHEILKNPENVKKYLDKEDDGLLIRVRMETGILFPACRIYRNGCQFVGPVHEQLDCKTTFPVSDVFIEHHRIDLQSSKGSEDRAKQRDDQMSRLMGGQIKKDKKNTRAAFHLALFYGAKRDWKNALKYAKKYLKFSDVAGGRWYMYYNIALYYVQQKKYLRALYATQDAIKINPYRWEISDLRGFIFFNLKNWQKAAECFVESFNANQGDITFQPKLRNLASTWSFIGECLFNQNKYSQAKEAFMRARQNCPDKEFKKVLDRRANLMHELSARQK